MAIDPVKAKATVDHIRDDAFRTFAVDPPYAARTIRGKLTKRAIELSEQISDGYVTDWNDYCKRIGVIRGLREAIAFCDDMEKEDENERRSSLNAR